MIILIITASGPKVGRLSVVDYSVLSDRERDVVRRLIPPEAYREGQLQAVLDLARALSRPQTQWV
jgi:hypothetical protein